MATTTKPILDLDGLGYFKGEYDKYTQTELDKKVDKVSGKGLSTNDYTTDEKNKLAGIATGANKTIVDSVLSSTSTNPVQNKVINTALNGKANSSHTHDDRYYTENEIDAKLDDKSDTGHKHTKSEITDFPTSMAANGGNSTTVNGHTVNSDVPSDAKFTDTVYTHPTTSGNKHIPSGGSSGQILRWSADGTAVWGNDNNTTYSNFVKSGSGAKAGLVPAPSTTAGTTKYLREDGTWTTPPNTTYSNMTAATSSAAGKAGLVPAPAAGKQGQYLRGDGTWATPTNTTYSVATQSANGLMSIADKKKLDSIAEGASVGNKTVYQKDEPTGLSVNDDWLKEY